MIQKIHIKNFRALKEVNVQLRPLTILLGPNDSGKTSFLEAIVRGLKGKFDGVDRWRGTEQPFVNPTETPGHAFRGTAEIFKLPSEGIPMESEGFADSPAKVAPPLATDGSNLAAFLDYLLRNDRQRFDRIQTNLRELVPGLSEISIPTPAPAKRAIAAKIEGGFEIPGARLSTGVRMLFFFVALAHHPNPPEVVLIEEPENGVHPRRLKDIVGLLRSLTVEKPLGRQVQVILTTHSPYLLDHVELSTDQVLVFRREEGGERTATEVNEERLRVFLDEFMLGEVWFNQGEEGLLAAAR